MSHRNPLRCLRLGFFGPTALAAAAILLASPAFADEADTMHLADEPGNWFRSDNTGTPLSIVDPGDEVDFRINNCCTNTRHTVTLLIKPTGSSVEMDQDQSKMGNLTVEFDVPGVYVFICKVHPYMTGVVAVRDQQGNIPPVTDEMLPFLSHLGVQSLPADAVLSVMTTVAASDDDKIAKWDILGLDDEIIPNVPGVGEVWINAQFERVPGQTDDSGVAKPGTITIVDAATFTVEREIDGVTADGQWNNPHNMWANFRLDTVYNSNWFGKWINKIDRESGAILDSITVGEAPTHIITIPTVGSGQLGVLTVPISADNDMVKVRDEPGGLDVIDSEPTGDGHTHPHGHWLTCGEGDRTIVPNVFKGLGFAGSISIIDTVSGDVLVEFDHDANDPIRSAFLMPIAVGECHVDGVSTAYVANLVSGMVTVIDVDSQQLITNIPVTLTPDGRTGFNLLHTLQGPIQTPVSPDEKWVATAVISLTTVDRANTGAADHVALIDTHTNEVVKFIPTPAGTHGVNWGAKLGGGYYAYVTNQHANVLTIIDPDPNGDGDASDGGVVGTILLANNSAGAGVTDGTGGQGIKPLPLTHDGWIQKTVDLVGTGELSDEVEGWIALLTDDQKNPETHHDVTIVEVMTAFGAITGGGILELDESDDAYLQTRSQFGFSASEPNIMDLRVFAVSGNHTAKTLSLTIESRVSNPGGVGTVRLRNHEKNTLQQVDSHDLNTIDTVRVIEDVDASNLIDPDSGTIEMSIKHVVIATFAAHGFESSFDVVRIESN